MQVLDLVNWRNLAFMYEQRLGVEMFKIMKGGYFHRRSPIFNLANSTDHEHRNWEAISLFL